MNRGFGFVGAAWGLLATVLAAGCGAGPNVTVAITSPISGQTIEAGQTVSITATTLSNGGNSVGGGVNWSLSGTGCSGSACGTLTNETGTSVTY
jgi:hypothetical protein